ncbi:hypothetical protein F66182_4143 [Fusarium sp. NRRL 66182]|nr:hypothetical protein F66182_4143 [Fusarium sp. NRRL 66182]
MLNYSPSELYYQRLTEQFVAENTPLLLSAAAAFIIGYLQYVYAIKLMLRDGRGPIPFWMHLFYLAHDSWFSYTIGSAAGRYDNHPFLRGTSIAYAIWSVLEIYCIYSSIRYHRQLEFSSLMGKQSNSLAAVLQYTLFMLAAMYCVVILMADLMGGPGCMMHWSYLTNAAMIVGPTHEFIRRGSRDGLAIGFCVVNVFCVLFTFAPFGMWVMSFPEVFDKKAFYLVGCVFFSYSVWLLNMVASYPPKPKNKTHSK